MTKKKIEPKVLKVVMGIPSEGHTLPEAYDNHLLLSFHLGQLEMQWKYENRNPRYEFYWHTIGRVLTPFAREQLTRQARELEADFILMYDDDMLLPIDMVECMLQDMEQRPEIDVLAPLAFMRNPPHSPVIYTTVDGYDTKTHRPYYKQEAVKDYPRDTLVECDGVGFGAALIRMPILKKMVEPYFMSTTGAGEDLWFCYQVKKAGGRIFMDTRIKLGHLGNPRAIFEEDFDKYNKDNGVEIEEKEYKYNYQK